LNDRFIRYRGVIQQHPDARQIGECRLLFEEFVPYEAPASQAFAWNLDGGHRPLQHSAPVLHSALVGRQQHSGPQYELLTLCAQESLAEGLVQERGKETMAMPHGLAQPPVSKQHASQLEFDTNA
jgi:hypothetical protein